MKFDPATEADAAAPAVVGRFRLREPFIVWCDVGFAGALGFAPTELIGAPARRLHADDASYASCVAALAPAGVRGELVRADLQHCHRDGTVKWFDVSAGPVAGNPGEIQAACIDISARRADWMELVLAERHYRSLFAAMGEGVVVHGADGQVIKANPAAERILRLSRDQILGKTPLHPQWRSVHADGSPLHGDDDPASITLRTGRPIRNQLMGVRVQGEEPRWISVNSQPVFDTNTGRPSSVMVTFVDVTEARAATETIARALAEKEVLLREIHHRVKNNMQVISSLLHLQSVSLQDPAAVLVLLECQSRIRSMALVHEQLYRSTSLTGVNFAEYLQDLARLIAASRETVQTDVSIDGDCDPIEVELETAVPLGLIANELLTNAFKHAFAGRSIGSLRLQLKGGEPGGFLLSITDDGVGLPPGFDLPATKSLGLHIVKTLVRQIRAEIALHAPAGGGTAVDIRVGAVSAAGSR